MKRRLAPALCLAFVCFTLFPRGGRAEIGADSTRYLEQRWQTPDGLPNNDVFQLEQAPDGAIWLATDGGLARFDGVEFRTVLEWPEGIPGQKIYARLTIQPNGTVWCTRGGVLYSWSAGRTTRQTIPLDPSRPFGNPILADLDGSLWIGGRGLLHWVGGQFQGLDSTGFPMLSVARIQRDARGTLWVLGEQVWRREGGRFEQFPFETKGSMFVLSYLQDREGAQWFGTDGDGLCRLRDGKQRWWKNESNLADSHVSALKEGGDGVVWLGTAAGIRMLRDERLVNPVESLPQQLVFDLYRDRENGLWADTSDGAVRLRPQPFAYSGSAAGVVNVNCICEGPPGTIWAGTTQSGVFQFRGGQWSAFAPEANLARWSVNALCVDGSTLWVGTARGVQQLRDGRVERIFDRASGLAEDWTKCLCLDAGGVLRVGTMKGLFRKRGESFEREPGIPEGVVQTIQLQPDGSLLAGLGGLGLWRGTQEGWTPVAEAACIAHASVFAIDRGEDGLMLAATSEGLAAGRDGKWRLIGQRDGLPNAFITSVLHSEDRIYLGSRIGLLAVNREEIDGLLAGKQTDLTVVSFGKADGLQSVVLGAGACRSRDGALWFPAKQGALVSSPDSLRRNPVAPAVAIQRVSGDGRELPLSFGRPVSAPFSREPFEIHFAATSFAAPEKVKYRWKLEGSDPEWSKPQDHRVAAYPRLPPGGYRFRVRACNADGVWSPREATMEIRILPPFYRTFWFLGATGCALAALGAVAYRWRMKRLRQGYDAILEERTRIARELHDTVEQSFTATRMQLEAAAAHLDEDRDRVAFHLKLAAQMIGQCVTEARIFVWDLRGGDSTRELPERLASAVERLRAGSGAAISLSSEGKRRILGSKADHHLARIAEESIYNALKHGSPTEIAVRLTFAEEHTRLEIRDDGCGFQPAEAATQTAGHFGLRGIQERARRIRATVEIQSAPRQGTSVVVILPAP